MTLTISETRPATKTFRGETEQYFRQIKGMRGIDIEMSELIDDKNRITLVSAIAGSGKSVLVKQLTYKWAYGELFKDKLCITFECRELNYFVINEGKQFKKQELIDEFIKAKFRFDLVNARDILFIVDGLDELYDINESESIISELLDVKKSKYPESKIIITGRPHIQHMLLRHGGKNMGCLRTVEIHGLSDEQIEEYICKFASSEDDIKKINKAKDSSQNNLEILHVPQMINSFCCVVTLSEVTGCKNAAELYCWSLYLLLKQHAENKGSRDKRIPEIFKEYSKDLLVLSKICHELLNKNAIIFEGNLEKHFNDSGKGKEFLMGLFTDVSDNFHVRKQFKHLALMEFLAAVYMCTTKNPTEIIKDILERKLYEVLLFSCQLISGLAYDGIIKEMFENAAELKEIDCYNFFCNSLKFVHECVTDYDDQSFNLSIDVLMCLMNRDASSKEFILAIVNELSSINVCSSNRKLIEMMKLLIRDFQCSEIELRKAFEKVSFWFFDSMDLNEMKYAKLLGAVAWIKLGGLMEMMTVRDIRKVIDEINECGNCQGIAIWGCQLQDMEIEDQLKESSKLEELQIWECNLTKVSFINLCNWIIISSVEEFQLLDIKDITVEWWNVLVDAIVNVKEKSDGNLALKKLHIIKCALMNDEMKKKVITFVLINSCSSSMVSP